MGRNTSEYPRENRAEHLDLNLQNLISGDPNQNNDLILAAFRDPEFKTGFLPREEKTSHWQHASTMKETLQEMKERALDFAHDLRQGASQKKMEKSIDGTQYSRTHGENWRDHLKATVNLSNALEDAGKDCIAQGILMGSEKQIAQGRTLLADSVRAGREMLDNPQMCESFHGISEKISWPGASPNLEELETSSAAQLEYMKAIRDNASSETLAERMTAVTAYKLATDDCHEAMEEIKDEIAALRDSVSHRADTSYQDILTNVLEEAAESFMTPDNKRSPARGMVESLFRETYGAQDRAELALAQQELMALARMGREEGDTSFGKSVEQLDSRIREGNLEDPIAHLKETIKQEYDRMPATENRGWNGEIREEFGRMIQEKLTEAEMQVAMMAYPHDLELAVKAVGYIQESMVLNHITQESTRKKAFDG